LGNLISPLNKKREQTKLRVRSRKLRVYVYSSPSTLHSQLISSLNEMFAFTNLECMKKVIDN